MSEESNGPLTFPKVVAGGAAGAVFGGLILATLGSFKNSYIPELTFAEGASVSLAVVLIVGALSGAALVSKELLKPRKTFQPSSADVISAAWAGRPRPGARAESTNSMVARCAGFLVLLVICLSVSGLLGSFALYTLEWPGSPAWVSISDCSSYGAGFDQICRAVKEGPPLK